MCICVVLVRPSLAANIGAVARVMANFGVGDLRLVQPVNYLDPATQAIARKGAGLLQQAQCFESLPLAVADMELVLGTSVRQQRHNFNFLSLHQVTANIAATPQQKMAVVFGRESDGLSNQELSHCTKLTYIESLGSLNLSHAVAVLLHSFNLVNPPPPNPAGKSTLQTAANLSEINGLKQQLFELLSHIGFAPKNKQNHLWQRLSALFNRVQLSSKEVRLGRAMVHKIGLAVKKQAPPTKP